MTLKKRRKLVPLIPLPQYTAMLAVSRAQVTNLRNRDPDFPPLVLLGVNRYAVRLDDAERYQQIREERAKQPRPLPTGLDPKRAAAASAIVRRRNAAARRAAQTPIAD